MRDHVRAYGSFSGHPGMCPVKVPDAVVFEWNEPKNDQASHSRDLGKREEELYPLAAFYTERI